MNRSGIQCEDGTGFRGSLSRVSEGSLRCDGIQCEDGTGFRGSLSRVSEGSLRCDGIQCEDGTVRAFEVPSAVYLRVL